MAVLRMPDIRKLAAPDAEKKLGELQRALLELAGEGRMEKARPLRKAIARLKIYLHQIKTNTLPQTASKTPKKPGSPQTN